MRVEVIACDVADPDARAGLFDEVDSRGLTVEILVNNAGIGTIGSVAQSPVADEIAQVRVNVEAVIDLTTRAVQQMVPRGRGAILNVGSTAGFHPFPGQAGYAGTKAFVQTYTEGLRARARGHRASPSPCCTQDRCGRSSCNRRAWTRGRSPRRFPKFLWMPSRDVAEGGHRRARRTTAATVIAGLPNS